MTLLSGTGEFDWRRAARWGSILLALTVGCRTPRPVLLPAAASERAILERVVPAAYRPPDRQGAEPLLPCATTDLPQPLPLADAIAYGLANNPRLRQAAARIDAARAGEEIAFAPFLPEFNGSYHYAAFTEPVIPGGAFVAASLTGGAYAYSLAESGVQWTLFDFGRTSGRYGQAITQTRIAELQLARAKQTVSFDVARAYFGVLRAQAFLRVREQAVREADAVLNDTKVRRDNGVADREAVLRAEVEVSQTREEVVAARQGVRDAEAALNLALGRPTGAPLVLEEPARPMFALPTLEQALLDAATIRPEVGIAREAVAEAAYGVEAARGQLKPKIFIRGTVIRADSEGPIDGWVAGAGAHVEQKLYAGGQYRAEVRRNRAQVAAMAAALQAILDNIGHQVNLAYQNIGTQEERIHLGETSMTQARENLRLTIVKFKNGNATPTDVVDAQTALTRAATRYYAALYDYLEALARLEYAQGGDQSKLIPLLAVTREVSPVLIGPPRLQPVDGPLQKGVLKP